MWLRCNTAGYSTVDVQSCCRPLLLCHYNLYWIQSVCSCSLALSSFIISSRFPFLVPFQFWSYIIQNRLDIINLAYHDILNSAENQTTLWQLANIWLLSEDKTWSGVIKGYENHYILSQPVITNGKNIIHTDSHTITIYNVWETIQQCPSLIGLNTEVNWLLYHQRYSKVYNIKVLTRVDLKFSHMTSSGAGASNANSAGWSVIHL